MGIYFATIKYPWEGGGVDDNSPPLLKTRNFLFQGRVDSYNIYGIQSAVQTFCKQVDKQIPPTQAAVSTALRNGLN